MIRNYLAVALRNLRKNKGYSAINIGGLAAGMTVAMLIGLWVFDELSFNTYHDNYPRIVQIMKGGVYEGKSYGGQRHLPHPLIEQLKTHYSSNFKHIVPFWGGDYVLSFGEKIISQSGAYTGEGMPDMLTLHMLAGTRSGLQDPHSILLSASTAKALFGETDNALNKIIQVNSKIDVKVTGVYEDLPYNTQFNFLKVVMPWALNEINNPWMKEQSWANHFLFIYAEIAPNTTLAQVNESIREAEITAIRNIPAMQPELAYSPAIMIHPMSDWHLYSSFKQGILENGPIQSVRIIGMIGGFVLLLACINFMNLSTARSEKRAKEVGIRKSIGSIRSQLIWQFYCESFLVVGLAFLLSLVAIAVALPGFNDLTSKEMQMPWTNLWFWVSCICFCVVTGVLAGSYPALYLSSFNAIRALKGTFRMGKLASLPRKVLVVMQFAVSVSLIIGTIIIYQQVMYAKDRPTGYDREGLVMVQRKTDEFFSQAQALRNELLKTGVVKEFAESGGQLTESWSGNGGFDWQGKDPALDANFATLSVSHTFGRAVGWQFVDGRDFSEEYASDSSGFVLNEAAVKYMNIKNPVNQIMHWKNDAYSVDRDYRILGVIKDMVMESPFEPVRPTIYFVQGWHGWFVMKIDPNVSISQAMPKIEAVFKKIIPSVPFDYKFTDQQFALKFASEERVGKLASVFSVLAIFISCLGLFGLASFVAEQRTKEIGIRKVVGASVFNLWQMLSKDFVVLTVVACAVAIPIAYYALDGWLQNYAYRISISGWVFLYVGLGAVLLTLITVSFQSVKAALMNPVNSLRSE
ncbi:FtsX-like permease family protein [Chryseolinea serpens]|uniref:FtsX-like permease family protein n=1 Tax=Chryseolinea serpens TaxID=947013 RepID=A0A1M5SAV4_9BACT|nr:FtsX-like permease family protein [Chryseolinea serpens]SHH35634.1 FtsX-like permease family protein [Chryseolinea serpens]